VPASAQKIPSLLIDVSSSLAEGGLL
jgi:hypothetical protein